MTSTEHTEEGRRLLQERLALLYRVGFLISTAFLLGVVVVRGLVGSSPLAELSSVSRWFHVLATLLCGGLWLWLRRATVEQRTLERADAAGILALVGLLNLNAAMFEVRTVSVFNIVLTTGVPTMLRAVVVPSTARRTLALSLAAALFALLVFALSALWPGWPVEQQLPAAGWPLSYQLISVTLWLGVLIAIATLTSRVVYHLRGEVRAARRLGQYILDAKLGEGGMGVVYRATHAMLRRETAIKLLLPDKIDGAALRRFEQEVVAMARLRHPNTVAIFDYGRTLDGVFYYAMEYLDGLTVERLVEQAGPLPPGRVVWLLDQVCAALEEAHEAGLVHRDIKPSNVMVVGRTAAYDFVKVVDFGLVKRLAVPADEPGVTGAQEVIGTPLYMAPESLTDPTAVDAKSDLYAVAAVGYFMLTGTHAFEGRSVLEICAAHLHTAPPPPAERLGGTVAPDLERLLMQGLAKAPADRPASAAAFRAALARCDVSDWTQQQARAWWTEQPPPSTAPTAAATGPSRTVEVAATDRTPAR